MKKIVTALTFVIFLFLLPASIFASSNFTTDYSVNYTINQDASTHVIINVSLTNLSDKYYASSYKIEVGFKDLKNLKASDEDGIIAPVIEKGENGSIIDLNFNKRSVGLGTKLNFKVEFDTEEIAENRGNVTEINIPGISQQNDFSTFNVIVNYPSSIGLPAYTKPQIENVKNQKPGRLIFNKTELGSSGISIGFGDYQIYEYQIKYTLTNKNLFPIKTEVALPPSTNYQESIVENIEPKPLNVREDRDGNWLAQFRLSSQEKKQIVATGKIRVFLNPGKEIISKADFSNYTQQKQYWETKDPRIKTIAEKVKTPREIYDYVVENLHYDFNRVLEKEPRLGASGVLNETNSAVCLEFTDLFIAIARAAGIPAREINGFAYTKNASERPLALVEDVLHSWPEYYDNEKESWIMVDPTWGNTTNGSDYFNSLDFDHLVFVRKGLNSSYPAPAGGYKDESTKGKDVEIKISSSFDKEEGQTVSSNFPSTGFGGIPLSGVIKIENIGNAEITPQILEVKTSFLTPTLLSKTVSTIPPYGHTQINLTYNQIPFLTKSNEQIKIITSSKTLVKEVKILPFFASKISLIGGGIFASICIIISFIITKPWRLYLSRREK